MLKLYKNIDGQLHYWETWEEDDKTGIIHWGKVGDHGQTEEIRSKFLLSFKKFIRRETLKKLKEGYTKIEEDKWSFLEIEYIIDEFGTEEDLQKRHLLEEKMNDLLGWTGLGECDGGSIGSGTMEVGCIVANYDIAKKIIVDNLKNTEFSDYSSIYELNNP